MNFENKLIAGIIQKGDIYKKVQRLNFDSKYFNKDLNKYLFDAIQEIEGEDTASKDSLKKYVDLDNSINPDKKSGIKGYIDKLAGKDISGVSYALSDLAEKKRKKELVKTLSYCTNKIEEGDSVDEIFEEIDDKKRELSKVETDFEINDYLSVDNFKERKVERAEINEGKGKSLNMVQNLEPFESNFPRGWQANSITVIMGPTGSGKSCFSNNVAYAATHPSNALNTLVVIGENREIQVSSRLDAIFLEKDYDDLFELELSDQEGMKFFRSANRKGFGRLATVKLEPHEYDVNTLYELVEAYEEKYDEKLDVLIEDSMDHRAPSKTFNKFYRQKSTVAYDTESFVSSLDLIYFGTLQVSTQGDRIKNEDVAGSKDFTRVADNVIGIKDKQGDKLLRRFNSIVTKARGGEITEHMINYYFSKSKKLIPWDEKFDNQIDPNQDADNIIKGMKKFQSDNFDGDPNTFNLQE